MKLLTCRTQSQISEIIFLLIRRHIFSYEIDTFYLQIGQQSIVTRFIKEFHLEQEAMALQYQANTIIKQVNSFIDGTPTEKVDNYGENVGEQGKIIQKNSFPSRIVNDFLYKEVPLKKMLI